MIPVLAVLIAAFAPPDGAPEIARAIQTWQHVRPELVATWATAIAGVCTTRRECLELAAIASLESRFAPYVLDFSCNDERWRHRAAWSWHLCDDGKAYGAFQIQDSSLLYASHELQASVALSILRTSPLRWSVWAKARALVDRWMARP